MKARKAFTGEDLEVIFRVPPVYSGERPTGGAGEAAHWLPLIGLYTGARLNEIGQLRVVDVRREGEIDYLMFTNTKAKASTSRKAASPASVYRSTPKLVRLGFLRYVASQKGDRCSPT